MSKYVRDDAHCKHDLIESLKPTILFESETGHNLIDEGEIEFEIPLVVDSKQTPAFNKVVIYYSGGNLNCGFTSLVVDISKYGGGDGQMIAMYPGGIYGIGRLSFGRIHVDPGYVFEGEGGTTIHKAKLTMPESEEYPNGSLNFKEDGTIDISNKNACSIKIHKVEAYKY